MHPITTVRTSPAEKPSASLPASADGQGVCTPSLRHGEVAPAVAQRVDHQHHFRRNALLGECLRFVAETGDREFAVTLWDALQLDADEAARCERFYGGEVSRLTDQEIKILRDMRVAHEKTFREGFQHIAQFFGGRA